MSLFIQLKMGGWEPMLYRAFAKMGDVSNERTFFNERWEGKIITLRLILMVVIEFSL